MPTIQPTRTPVVEVSITIGNIDCTDFNQTVYALTLDYLVDNATFTDSTCQDLDSTLISLTTAVTVPLFMAAGHDSVMDYVSDTLKAAANSTTCGNKCFTSALVGYATGDMSFKMATRRLDMSSAEVYDIQVATFSPSPAPTPAPTTSVPTAVPLPAPTAVPLPVPTAVPLPVPTAVPVPSPTAVPIPSPTAVPLPAPTAAPVVTPTSTNASAGSKSSSSAGIDTTMIIIIVVVVIFGCGIGGVAAAMMFGGKGAAKPPAPAAAPESSAVSAPERAVVTNPAAASDETVELGAAASAYEVHLAGLAGEDWSEC